MPDDTKRNDKNPKRNENKQQSDRDSRRVGQEQQNPTRQDPSRIDEDEIPAV